MQQVTFKPGDLIVYKYPDGYPEIYGEMISPSIFKVTEPHPDWEIGYIFKTRYPERISLRFQHKEYDPEQQPYEDGDI